MLWTGCVSCAAGLKDLPVVSLTEQELQGYNERSSQEMKRGKKDKDFGERRRPNSATQRVICPTAKLISPVEGLRRCRLMEFEHRIC